MTIEVVITKSDVQKYISFDRNKHFAVPEIMERCNKMETIAEFMEEGVDYPSAWFWEQLA